MTYRLPLRLISVLPLTLTATVLRCAFLVPSPPLFLKPFQFLLQLRARREGRGEYTSHFSQVPILSKTVYPTGVCFPLPPSSQSTILSMKVTCKKEFLYYSANLQFFTDSACAQAGDTEDVHGLKGCVTSPAGVTYECSCEEK
jgi:hypothetical protein